MTFYFGNFEVKNLIGTYVFLKNSKISFIKQLFRKYEFQEIHLFNIFLRLPTKLTNFIFS